jgi:hypothetical protein
MRILFISFLLLTIKLCNAQLTLQPTDLNNLVAISKLYSQNTNAKSNDFAQAIDSLRTPALNHIADALIAIENCDKSIFEPRFLAKPDNDELVLWYVIREIHYNRKSKRPQPDIDIANKVLSKQFDDRWLLDNYYYRISRGIGFLFNNADLSEHNINMDSLGLKNDTEKAIFFLNILDALAGGRFQVLHMMKKYDEILEFCHKLPSFNGKQYYHYKNFSYEDFKWIGHVKTELYNKRHIGDLYATLMIQFTVTATLKRYEEAQEIYLNSILHEPKYFKYTTEKESLQVAYDKY